MVISSRLPIYSISHQQNSIGPKPGKITFGMHQDQFTSDASGLEELVKNPKSSTSQLQQAAENYKPLSDNPEQFKIIKNLIQSCIASPREHKLYFKLVTLTDMGIPLDHSLDAQETEFDLLTKPFLNNKPKPADMASIEKCVKLLLQHNVLPYNKTELPQIIERLSQTLAVNPEKTDNRGIAYHKLKAHDFLADTPYAHLSPLHNPDNDAQVNIYNSPKIFNYPGEEAYNSPTTVSQVIPFLSNCETGTIAKSVEQVLDSGLNLKGMENEIYDTVLRKCKKQIKSIAKNEKVARATKKELTNIFTSSKDLFKVVWRSIGLTSKRDTRDGIRNDAFDAVELLIADKMLPTWKTTPKENLDKLCAKFRFTKQQKDKLQSYYRYYYSDFYKNYTESTSSVSSVSTYDDSGSEVGDGSDNDSDEMDLS